MAVQVDLVTLTRREAQHRENRRATGEQRNTREFAHKTDSVKSPTEIVEAQGWVVDANGNLHLVATAPNINPHNPLLTPTSCPAN